LTQNNDSVSNISQKCLSHENSFCFRNSSSSTSIFLFSSCDMQHVFNQLLMTYDVFCRHNAFPVNIVILTSLRLRPKINTTDKNVRVFLLLLAIICRLHTVNHYIFAMYYISLIFAINFIREFIFCEILFEHCYRIFCPILIVGIFDHWHYKVILMFTPPPLSLPPPSVTVPEFNFMEGAWLC